MTGKRVLVKGQVDARLSLLRAWLDAGASLENHSYSHRSFYDLTFEEYTEDVMKGQLIPELLMEERNRKVQFFRHPFNHTGKVEARREKFESFLERHGLTLTPFTIEHSDYVYNKLYRTARDSDDEERMEQIVDAYHDQLVRALSYFEETSQEVWGRQIPQILLIHANLINSYELDRMLDLLEDRGYRFISLSEALQDPIYQREDPYLGGYGISWIHRWRSESQDVQELLRAEPGVPDWVLRGYRKK